VANDDVRMTFTEHLAELRGRLIRAILGLLAGFIICVIFSEELLEFVIYPLRSRYAEGQGPGLTVLNPTEAFMVRLRLALYAGFILSLPYVLYQTLAFVFPGLKPKERRAVWYLLWGGGILMVAGFMLAYFGVLPLILPYLMAMAPEGVETQLRVSETVSFVLQVLVGFAVAFQLPVVVLILSYLGLVTPRMLVRYRRVSYVGIAVLSAVFTPPDPQSMLLLMIPMIVLYEISIFASRAVYRAPGADEGAA
jgi:sec-independent protein translocase protein TatC